MSYRVEVIEILERKGSINIIHPLVHISGHIVQSKIVGRELVDVGRNNFPIIGGTAGDPRIIPSASFEVGQEVPMSRNSFDVIRVSSPSAIPRIDPSILLVF